MKLPDPKRLLGSVFPILRWSKGYDAGTAIGDLIAGVTVALTLIPQAIAYASLAGLEPQYGLYASLAGGFVYGLTGTCPQINIGPTALLALLTATYTADAGPDFAVLLCLTSGLVQLLAGALQLGLYASLAGGFVYGLLALLTATYTADAGPDFAVLLCLTSGLVQLLAGALQLGLYASLAGGFVYWLLALLTAKYMADAGPDFAVLLCFKSGLVQLLAGALQLGLYASLAGGFVYGLLALLTATYTADAGLDFAVLLCLTSGLVQLLAGVLQLGLYASLAGGFVYGLLALLTAIYTADAGPDFAVLLCLTSGLVQLLAGALQLGLYASLASGFVYGLLALLTATYTADAGPELAGALQLGFLVEFVSLPVVSGFTSAAAVTIASSQIKGLLGLKYRAETFIATWKELFRHIGDTRLADTLLSLACCCILFGMKALKDIHIGVKDSEKSQKGVIFVQRSFWFAGVSRNAVVVVLAAVVAYFVCVDVADPLILTGSITPGLPTLQAPPFHTTLGNVTVSTGGMLAHLGSGLLVVPLVGIISNVAIAKAFSNGKTLDATQEIIALGACNLVGAFFRSFPVNGSFTRSAVSDASGVRSPAAGFYTGIIVLLTLALLTPYFYFIPRAALAAVIVCAVLHMVDVAIVRRLWRSSRLDIIPLVGTFVCCLALGIELGLICGVAIDLLLLLFYNSRPPLDVQYIEEETLPPHYSIHPVGSLHFAGAEKVRSKLSSLRNKPILQELRIVPGLNDSVLSNGTQGNGSAPGSVAGPRANVLVIHCDSLYRLDYTFLQSIKMLVSEWSRGGSVVWCDARPPVRDQLSAVLPDLVYCDSQHLSAALADAASSGDHSGVSDTQL